MARFLPLAVFCFLLIAACAALCQQRDEPRPRTFLPDAPSVQASGKLRIFRTSVDAAGSARKAWASPQASFKEGPVQTQSSDFFGRHLYPTLVSRNLNYHPSTSASLMGRATYAASRVFYTRDQSGKGRLNTSYFLGVLGSAFVHTAYRPYWNRPVSAPFNDFGSTLGNDAGMNLWREFGPGLQQLVKSHTPKFVSAIEARIGQK